MNKKRTGAKLNLNKKIAKIPFWILYSILAFLIMWDFVFTYFTIKTNPNASEGNPVNAYLMHVFGLEYFLWSLPIILIMIYFVIRLGDWMLVNVDKRTDINGNNHIAIMGIMLVFPNVLRMFIKLFSGVWIIRNWGLKYSFLSGFVLMMIYIILTEYIFCKKK